MERKRMRENVPPSAVTGRSREHEHRTKHWEIAHVPRAKQHCDAKCADHEPNYLQASRLLRGNQQRHEQRCP